MNKYILSTIAVLLASMGNSIPTSIAHTGQFIKSPQNVMCVYAFYDGTGSQSNCANYSTQETLPRQCPGSSRLCWLKVCDYDGDGDIDCDDFSTAFDILDTDNDGTLDDHFEDHIALEHRF